jgi:8-oxo-dGTP diphosphatase
MSHADAGVTAIENASRPDGRPPIEVTAAVFLRDGRVLLARRPAGDPLEGKWELPGGKVEAGETPEMCLARELTEECGVTVTVGSAFAQSDYNYPHVAIRLLAYRIEAWTGELLPRAHDALAWVNREQLEACDVAPADIPILERLMHELD